MDLDSRGGGNSGSQGSFRRLRNNPARAQLNIARGCALARVLRARCLRIREMLKKISLISSVAKLMMILMAMATMMLVMLIQLTILMIILMMIIIMLMMRLMMRSIRMMIPMTKPYVYDDDIDDDNAHKNDNYTVL